MQHFAVGRRRAVAVLINLEESIVTVHNEAMDPGHPEVRVVALANQLGRVRMDRRLWGKPTCWAVQQQEEKRQHFGGVPCGFSRQLSRPCPKAHKVITRARCALHKAHTQHTLHLVANLLKSRTHLAHTQTCFLMRTRALALLLVGCASATPVPVTVWSMSGCPCSAQFAFDFNASIWSLPEMRSAIEFKQPFSASAKKDNLTSCFHGDKECRFEKWLLCAQVQDFDAAFDWELCVDGHCTGDFFPNLDPCSTQYENPDNATLMQTCAAKAGLDYAKLQACAAGAEGEQLLLEDARHYTASYGIQGLPVVQVAGKVPLAELPSPSREFEQVPALSWSAFCLCRANLPLSWLVQWTSTASAPLCRHGSSCKPNPPHFSWRRSRSRACSSAPA